MTVKTIEIRYLDGTTRTVDAFVIGDLALHASRVNPKLWVVTHVPTHMSFKSVVPPSVLKSKAKTLAWMKKVQTNPRTEKDWLAMRKFTREDVMQNPDATKTIRGRIREHCLSIKE